MLINTLIFLLGLFCSLVIAQDSTKIEFENVAVSKHVLTNGLTVLVRPINTTQKVSLRLFYGVGSKHEGLQEKGIAHLIEHMLFKGTDRLSETDIDLIGQKFSANWNAFTSYDHTAMVFDFPTESWKIALPILADCMSNCTFRQEMLNSELKAVIQELKIYRDNYAHTLVLDMLTAINPEHPYHYPIIGYKHDLYNVSADTLKKFYKKHYVPNNAILVVVGNVDPREVVELAQLNFGHLPADPSYQKSEFYLNADLRAQAVTIYRDVQQPKMALAFAVPGKKQKQLHLLTLIDIILARGKTSRLYKKLVDELQLVDSLEGFNLDLDDTDMYTLMVEPRDLVAADQIINVVQEELRDFAQHGPSADEIDAAIAQLKANFFTILESNSQQANTIGDLYIAIGDENYFYKIMHEVIYEAPEALSEKVKAFTSAHFRSAQMHKGFILPLPAEEFDTWQMLQERSDEEDARILAGKIRTLAVEEGRYVKTLDKPAITVQNYPQPQEIWLGNGIRVLYHITDQVPLVKLNLNIKAGLPDYEPKDKPGLFECLGYMLQEGGTQKHTAYELFQELKRLGITFSVNASGLTASCISKDLPQMLALLGELIAQPAFDPAMLSKVKAWMLASYKNLWDDPRAIMGLIRQQLVFRNHPNAVDHVAEPAAINAITNEDIKQIYTTNISPCDATLILVGDLGSYLNLKGLLEGTFGTWTGGCTSDMTYPDVQYEGPQTVSHYLNRDQVSLTIAGLSVPYSHPDHGALLLYEQLLYDRLFKLRQQTGAFYTVRGSLLAWSSLQPGYSYVSTIVSNDRLDETYQLLRDFIVHDIDTLTEQDLEMARANIAEAVHQYYATTDNIVRIFEFLAYHKLPFDYYNTRMQAFQNISVDDVKQAVKKVFAIDKMSTVLVGRVGPSDQCTLVPGTFDTKCHSLDLITDQA